MQRSFLINLFAVLALGLAVACYAACGSPQMSYVNRTGGVAGGTPMYSCTCTQDHLVEGYCDGTTNAGCYVGSEPYTADVYTADGTTGTCLCSESTLTGNADDGFAGAASLCPGG